MALSPTAMPANNMAPFPKVALDETVEKALAFPIPSNLELAFNGKMITTHSNRVRNLESCSTLKSRFFGIKPLNPENILLLLLLGDVLMKINQVQFGFGSSNFENQNIERTKTAPNLKIG